MRTLLPLLFLAAFTFAACDSTKRTADTPADMSDATVTESAGGLPGSPMMNPLDLLSAATSAGGLTKLSLPTAIAAIDGFLNVLKQRDGTSAITGDLQKLKGELTAGKIDGGKVSRLLGSLGTKTVDVAGDDTNYATLGRALSKASASLGK